MAFDTAAAAESYKTVLNSYKSKIRNVQNRLNSDFNLMGGIVICGSIPKFLTLSNILSNIIL